MRLNYRSPVVYGLMAVAAVASYSRANSVTFTTTGKFSASGSSSFANLTFQGVSKTVPNAPTSLSNPLDNFQIGKFSFTDASADVNVTSLKSSSFTLTLSQSLPSGSASTLGSFTGTFASDDLGSDVKIVFSPATIGPIGGSPNYLYVLGSSSFNVPGSINADVIVAPAGGSPPAVPVPMASTAGLVGLLGFGIRKLRQRKIAV